MTEKTLKEKVLELKRSKDALMLVPNYQIQEVQEIADFIGDSLELARKAAEVKKKLIVFCGVRFMAETAKILNPDAKVLIPRDDAGCPMADMITRDDLIELKRKFPDAVVCSYVNTNADVKAESDVCCTSSNAAAVVESLNSDTVIFIPDEYLARNVAKETGKHIIFPTSGNGSDDTEIDYQMIGWRGRCEVHEKFTVQDIKNVRRQFPDVAILAHPECPSDVLDLADEIKSTSGMIAFAVSSGKKELIIGTETGILYPMTKAAPDKVLIPADQDMVCPDMKKTGLREIQRALEELRPEVKVPEDVRVKAKGAVDRMLAIPLS